MAATTHVVVLMGGMSAEYEVSMNSGRQVVDHLDPDRHRVTPVEITRNGEWVFPGDAPEYLDVFDALPKLKKLDPDCVFIALHGPYGEDGRIQGMFDLLGIPYTGSGCAASALSMDKIRSKALAEHAGIKVPKHVVFRAYEYERQGDVIRSTISVETGYPCVLKNPLQGSSLGMAIVESQAELKDTLVRELFSFGSTIMAEEYIDGREFTCGVLDLEEGVEPTPLPVTEIAPVKARFFDYQAKYTPGATTETTPAEIDERLRDRIQDIALHAHTLMGCRGFSRSDMIATGDGEIYWLEVNTIPGLTITSLIPQAAEAAGISFSDLVGRLVQAALI